MTCPQFPSFSLLNATDMAILVHIFIRMPFSFFGVCAISFNKQELFSPLTQCCLLFFFLFVAVPFCHLNSRVLSSLIGPQSRICPRPPPRYVTKGETTAPLHTLSCLFFLILPFPLNRRFPPLGVCGGDFLLFFPLRKGVTPTLFPETQSLPPLRSFKHCNPL